MEKLTGSKFSPTLKDLRLGSIKSAADLRDQADILARIANVKMDEYMHKAPEQIQRLHDRGIPKELLFGGLGTLCAVSAVAVVLLYGFKMLSVFFNVLQPLYYTFYALESTQKDDDTVWLTYWMVHTVLISLEHTLFVPIINLFPGLFFFGKLVLQFWMVNFEGSTFVYERILAPFLRSHEKKLQETIDVAKRDALAAVGFVKKELEEEIEERERVKNEQHDI